MKLVSLEMLQYFKTKLEGFFVKKELKTGSTTEYKQLSDNNLTDDLVQKINEAGSATAVTESIATAKSEAISESKAYTDEQVSAAKTELNTAITTATDDMATQTWVGGQIETATDDMATNASVDEKIAGAKSYADTAEADAVATAKSYTDEQVGAAKTAANTYTDEQVAAAKTALQTEIGTAKTEANTYTDNQVAAAKTELNTTINTKISTAYKIKGSTTFANLPALSEAEEGHVYNVTDAFTTNANFVEGASKKYPAGSNVVCIEESEGVFKYDVLAGFIDTDTFVKTTDIEIVTEAEVDAMFAA